MFLNQGRNPTDVNLLQLLLAAFLRLFWFSLISGDGESRLALAACRAEAQTQTPKAPSVRQIALGAVPEALVGAEELAAPRHARNGRPLAQSRCSSLLGHAIQKKECIRWPQDDHL